MKQSWICTAAAMIMFAFPMPVLGQDLGKGVITGTITDSSQSPVVGANVFINNSTLGSSTNEFGSFIIRNVPYGSYELIVSHINYNVARQLLVVGALGETQISLKLAPRSIMLPEISVVSEYPKDWHDNLQRFLPLLLGTTEFAEQCVIENPEVLEFRYERSSFRAFANRPVKVRNSALGYFMFITIDSFALDGRWLLASWDAKFESIEPDGPEDSTRWEINRDNVFNASYRHFLISLINGKLAENKIHIFQVPAPRMKRDPSMRYELSANDIIVKKGDHWILDFKDYLEVECRSQTIWVGYDPKLRVNRKRAKVSWLRLENGPVTISINGIVFPKFGVRVVGDWAGERVANAVPVDIKGHLKR